MLASSKDPYGNGFREVEIVEEDKSDFGFFSTTKDHRNAVKRHFLKIKGTDAYEIRKELNRKYLKKIRINGYHSGREWTRQNKNRHNETRRVWVKKSGYSKRRYTLVAILKNTIYKESGYIRISTQLRRYCGIRPPLNFTMAYTDRPWLKKGQWAWTFAHP